MGVSCANEVNNIILTQQGAVYIEGPVEADYISKLKFNQDLSNFRPPDQQKKALMEITGIRQGMVYIARNADNVVGYVSFHEPDSFSRWSKHPLVIELGAIEVSPTWRKYKLGLKLLEVAFSNPVMEDNILLTIEFCWHWDIEKTGLNIWQYQKMLTRLFGSVGLIRVNTNDPDVMEHAANVLMARVGKNVSHQEEELFEKLKFN